MVKFCRNWLKNDPNCRTLSMICEISIQWQFLSLVVIKILVLVSGSILILNTATLTLVKPKSVNGQEKVY